VRRRCPSHLLNGGFVGWDGALDGGVVSPLSSAVLLVMTFYTDWERRTLPQCTQKRISTHPSPDRNVNVTCGSRNLYPTFLPALLFLTTAAQSQASEHNGTQGYSVIVASLSSSIVVVSNGRVFKPRIENFRQADSERLACASPSDTIVPSIPTVQHRQQRPSQTFLRTIMYFALFPCDSSRKRYS
jgi:hypothetical protein